MIIAHGVGAGADLPVETWLLAYAASAALLICAAALRLAWPEPRLAVAAPGRPLPAWTSTTAAAVMPVVRTVALGLYLLTLAAAWFGDDATTRNLAPLALHVVFWVGVPVLSAVFGDWWRQANPLWTIAAGLDRLRARDPETSSATGLWASHWPAAMTILGLGWLQQAFFDPDAVTAVALLLSVHAVLVLAGAARFGAGWVRTGDGFAVLFHLVAALSPLCHDRDGRLRLRPPVAGLAAVEVRPGTAAVVLVVIGVVAFDALRDTEWWRDAVLGLEGWDLTATSTVGLLLTIATVALAAIAVVRAVDALAGADGDVRSETARWVPALVPVALAGVVAHHLPLLVVDAQALVALVSDPLGRGWDLFGTAGHRIDRRLVPAGPVALAQVGVVVAGHLVAVVAAHDRAVDRWSHGRAVRSQAAVLAGAVASTVLLVVLPGA